MFNRRPYLVVMRTGQSALLPQWLQHDQERNWDVWVSRYAEGPAYPEAIGSHLGGYNKFYHVWDSIKSGQLDLSAYSYVMLADDDLALELGTISSFFEQVALLGLTVAHPAQSPAGYWSHALMLHDEQAIWRETNFIEVMCPCFKTSFLLDNLDAIPLTYSTWGIDFGFCYLARRSGGRVGILDTTVIRHTKPISPTGPFYQKLTSHGISPLNELQQVLWRLPADARTPRLISTQKRPEEHSGLKLLKRSEGL